LGYNINGVSHMKAKCRRCGKTSQLTFLMGTDIAVKRPQLNFDRLYPCYLCEECYREWCDFWHKNKHRWGNYHKNFIEIWNRLFREFMNSEPLIFV